jgi:hypothetical protein
MNLLAPLTPVLDRRTCGERIGVGGACFTSPYLAAREAIYQGNNANRAPGLLGVLTRAGVLYRLPGGQRTRGALYAE